MLPWLHCTFENSARLGLTLKKASKQLTSQARPGFRLQIPSVLETIGSTSGVAVEVFWRYLALDYRHANRETDIDLTTAGVVNSTSTSAQAQCSFSAHLSLETKPRERRHTQHTSYYYSSWTVADIDNHSSGYLGMAVEHCVRAYLCILAQKQYYQNLIICHSRCLRTSEEVRA